MSTDNLVAVPTLGPAGTGGATLAAQYGDALDAITAAILATRKITVDSRNYTRLDGSSSFPRARREQLDRLARLQAVMAELSAIYYSVHEQLKAREGNQ